MLTGLVSWVFQNFDPSMDVGTPAIECFKWCGLKARVVTMVIKEFDLWQMVNPIISRVNHSCFEHISLCLNRSLISGHWSADDRWCSSKGILM